MKIAIVIEKFHPAAGGNERSTQQIARQLIARGHDVTILTDSAASQEPLLPNGGQVVTFGSRLGTRSGLGLLMFANWAERKLRNGGFDASLSVTPAVPAMVVQPRGGTVKETLERNVSMRPTPWRRLCKRVAQNLNFKQHCLLAAERRTYDHKSVRKVVAISRYVAEQLFHYYTVSSRRTVLIPNAAEVQALDPIERQVLRNRARTALQLREDDVVFLFLARNPALKGLSSLLAAMRQVKRMDSRARLVIAGSLGHASVRAVAGHGLEAVVRCAGPTRQADALYAAADVTVLPTWYDPSSKVVLESLLHGVPAISTLYNGASQWILSPTGRAVLPSPFDRSRAELTGDPQPAGRVIDRPDNVPALALAMLQLCEDDERERCSAATIGLDTQITMKRHVDDMEAVLVEASRG